MSGVVVIGAGQAGASLVARLRSKGFDGNITMIGAENAPPYQRPPLSKAYLLGDMERERLFLRPEQYYADHNIRLITGETVTQIDTAAKEITVGDETLAYDNLAFCTGADPILLPPEAGGNLDGIYTVRNLADVDAMAPEFVAGRKVLIVGGGYIGLEAAAVARKFDLDVTLVHRGARILSRVASPETADYFRDLHQGHGVDLREGTGLARLTGDTRVTGAVLSDGTELDVDFVIAGIGVSPATALAETAGVTLDNGITTDAYGRCSIAGLWSAGDCASFPGPDGQMRLESVGNAIDQAELVADNIMGAERAYMPKPWFWSDQYDVKLQIAGLLIGYTDVVIRDAGAGVRSHWYYRDDTLIALDAMNDGRGYMVGKRLIEAGKSPDKADISDVSSDLKAIMKAAMAT